MIDVIDGWMDGEHVGRRTGWFLGSEASEADQWQHWQAGRHQRRLRAWAWACRRDPPHRSSFARVGQPQDRAGAAGLGPFHAQKWRFRFGVQCHVSFRRLDNSAVPPLLSDRRSTENHRRHA
jgi:hypothetical protein